MPAPQHREKQARLGLLMTFLSGTQDKYKLSFTLGPSRQLGWMVSPGRQARRALDMAAFDRRR